MQQVKHTLASIAAEGAAAVEGGWLFSCAAAVLAAVAVDDSDFGFFFCFLCSLSSALRLALCVAREHTPSTGNTIATMSDV
jgi:hypothetical protein